MATLRNLTDTAMYCPQPHVMVPGNGEVEIADADAEKVNTASGVWSVATRRQVTRGAKQAEITDAPAMEKRG